MARDRLTEMQTPAYWSAAVYREVGRSGAYRFEGYTKPKLATWHDFFAAVPHGIGVSTVHWRWDGAQWVKW
jgi:hypothetical protein